MTGGVGGATRTQTLRGRSFNPNPSIRVDARAKVEKLLEGGGACTANAMCAYSLRCRSTVRLDVKEGGGAWGGTRPANAMCAYSIVLTPRRVLKGRRARDLPIAVPALAFVESVRNATFSAVGGK